MIQQLFESFRFDLSESAKQTEQFVRAGNKPIRL